MIKSKRHPIMDDNSANIKVEDTVFSSKNLSSNLQPIVFVDDEPKIKIEFTAEDTNVFHELGPTLHIADYVKKEIKAENVDGSSEDLVLPAENIPHDGGHCVDTYVITKEENLVECLKEEDGSSQSDFDSCKPSENEDRHRCGKAPDETYENEHPPVPTVSSPVKAEEHFPPGTQCGGSGTLRAVSPVSDSESPFLCAECGAGFKVRHLFKQHLVTVHRKLLSCPYCLAAISDHGHLKTHLATHVSASLFSCKECTTTFVKKKHLVEHLAGHSNARPYLCVYCSCVFVESNELRIHLTAHVEEERNSPVSQAIPPHPCDLCPGVLSDSKALKAHMANHSDTLNSCGQLFAMFKDKECLEPDDSSQKPSSSSSSFDKRSKIRRIYSKTANHAGKLFRCGVCPRRFKSEVHLRLHFDAHFTNAFILSNPLKKKKKNPFICNQCGLKFLRKDYLKQHIMSHSKENVKQKCPDCGAMFENSIAFQKHMISHLDPVEEKCFACAYCPATFKCGQHLRQHLFIHSTDELFWCVPCSKSFAHKIQLHNHMMTHLTPHDK